MEFGTEVLEQLGMRGMGERCRRRSIPSCVQNQLVRLNGLWDETPEKEVSVLYKPNSYQDYTCISFLHYVGAGAFAKLGAHIEKAPGFTKDALQSVQGSRMRLWML